MECKAPSVTCEISQKADPKTKSPAVDANLPFRVASLRSAVILLAFLRSRSSVSFPLL